MLPEYPFAFFHLLVITIGRPFGLLTCQGEWAIRTVANAQTELMYDGTAKLCTLSTGSCTIGTHHATTSLTSPLVCGTDYVIGKLFRISSTGANSGASLCGYGIYQDTGAWSSPYPDMIINYHTGIKFGAYKGYGGF